jgi:hypothetical protein
MGQTLVGLLAGLLATSCEAQPVAVTVPSSTVKTTTTTTTTVKPASAPAPAPAPRQDTAAASTQAAPDEAAKLNTDQLKSLVAPIALYPDPLLAQCLAASTYPLDLMEAQQWLAQNSSLKGDALEQAAEKQDWDPSVQSMVMIPDALKRMTEDIRWTTDLGNAFLAQQAEVMDAVQLLRNEAKSSGKLESTEQMKVETKVVEQKTIVEIQPASTQVVYVPSYSPTVVWGAPVYAYPPMYYPPYTPGAALFTFGMGMAWGAAISGGWGYGCGWGGGNNNITINNNNNFNRNSNRTNNVNRSGNSNWQHNASNRKGAPYGDRATANKYGGGARGDSASARQSQARSRQADSMQRGSNSALSNRSGGAGASNRSAGSGNVGGGSRSGGSGSFSGGGGGDRVGNRSVSQSSRGSSGFSGGSGSRASASSARGSSSMGSRGGGGHRGGGGGGRRR